MHYYYRSCKMICWTDSSSETMSVMMHNDANLVVLNFYNALYILHGSCALLFERYYIE
jgi:hypothetical protein